MTVEHEKTLRIRASELRKVKSWLNSPNFEKKINDRYERIQEQLKYRKGGGWDKWRNKLKRGS